MGKFWLMWLSLLLVLFSACYVMEAPPDIMAKAPPVKAAPVQDENVPKGRQVVSPPSSPMSKSAPRRDNGEMVLVDGNEAEQSAQTPEPCEGIPSEVKVDPRVQKFLTCDVIQLLSQPDRVQSFRVKPEKADSSISIANRLGHFPIESDGQGLNLEGANLKRFQKLVFSENSYHFGMEKRCRFRPDMGLYFVKNDKGVEILFSTSCNLWLFVYGGEEKLEDFDPIQDQLVFLKSLFPMETEEPETPAETPETPETPAETPETPMETSETSVDT